MKEAIKKIKTKRQKGTSLAQPGNNQKSRSHSKDKHHNKNKKK